MLKLALICLLGSLPQIALSSTCKELLCHHQKLCRFGYEVDINGCETCACKNPCDESVCPTDTYCHVTENGGQCLRCRGKARDCMDKVQCPSGRLLNKAGDCVWCKCYNWCPFINCAEGQQCMMTAEGLFQCVGNPVCPTLHCFGNCTKGVKKDIYDCPTCECIDACTDVDCDAGSYCKVNDKGDPHCIAMPIFTETPKDMTAMEDHTFTLSCNTDSDPPANIQWLFNGGLLPVTPHVTASPGGRFLSIVKAGTLLSGTYTCVAQGVWGAIRASATVTISPADVPVINKISSDVSAKAGSKVVLQCEASGVPQPQIIWKKNDNLVKTSETRERYCNGTLIFTNLTKHDEGRYLCEAGNFGGRDRQNTFLDVTAPDIDFATIENETLIEVVSQIKYLVYSTVEETIKNQSDVHHKRNAEELLRLFKYPSKLALHISESADVFEMTLKTIFEKISPSESVSYSELFRSDDISLLAELSGCKAAEEEESLPCSDICFHQKYRTLDGTCNNLKHPSYGAAVTPLLRILPAAYDNQFNFPKGWREEVEYNNFRLPSARKASVKIAAAPQISEDKTFSHMVMQWGQFLDHDVGLTPHAVTSTGYSTGETCGTKCEFEPPCFPIAIPEDDPRRNTSACMSFVRSSATCGVSGDYQSITSREQINELTSYIDGSQIYGISDAQSNGLRDFNPNRGLMRAGVVMPSGLPLLPPNTGESIACDVDSSSEFYPCFQAGDIRANEQLGLLSMHTLWFREHNRVAKKLREINMDWDGHIVYNEARKIVGAQLQHITYRDWLPIILGTKGMELLGSYRGYDPSVNAGLANSFSTAAFRFGHALVNPIIERLDCMFNPIPEGNLPLHKAFFAPRRLVEEGGIDPVLRGLFASSSKELLSDEILNKELSEKLFKLANAIGLDLGALNIQRGRDHGLPSYNAFRKHCGLSDAQTFDDLANEITDIEVRLKLEEVYGHPDNVDIWIGGLTEEAVEGGIVGPTFSCIIADQFRRLRDGDRFWYENDGVFTPAQLTEIRETSLARVICDNSDGIEHVPKNVFIKSTFPEGMLTCDSSDLPYMELRMWNQCCDSYYHGC